MKGLLFFIVSSILVVFIFACGNGVGGTENSSGTGSNATQTKNNTWGSLTWGTNKWEKKNE